jgi:guanylate kinase
MKNLFLIDGPSGSGKSDLMEFVHDRQQDIAFVTKYTTRKKRDYEIRQQRLLDLAFVSQDKFNELNLEYQYLYGGYNYGFSKVELETCLENQRNVFVIVRNAPLIRLLKQKYSFINVIAVFVYTDEQKVRIRLEQQESSKEQINYRMDRISEAFDDYVRNSEIYDEIIINNSDRPVYHRLFQEIVSKYKTVPEIDENLIFVLMSSDKKNPALKDYYSGMQRAVLRINPKFRCLNLDDVTYGSPRISETAKQKIRNCRVAIVDLTENKLNVYYELGYVHGIKRPCVITALQGTDPAFYSAEYRIIYYNSATELEEKLVTHLSGVL